MKQHQKFILNLLLTLTVLLYIGSNKTHAQIGSVEVAPESSVAIVSGDFNNDGNLDYIIAAREPGRTHLGKAYLYLGKGDGTFKEQK